MFALRLAFVSSLQQDQYEKFVRTYDLQKKKVLCLRCNWVLQLLQEGAHRVIQSSTHYAIGQITALKPRYRKNWQGSDWKHSS